MTAWQIYWVMQLDSIGSTLCWFGWMGALAAAGAGVFHLLTDCEFEVASKIAKRAAVVSCVSALLTAFIPSTKTAAAMIVLPAIANSETLRKEAGELYGLAKEALRDAIDAPEPKEQSK